MQDETLLGRSLGRTAIVVLLIMQCVRGLFFSLPFPASLLAPGRPVIVTGTSILTVTGVLAFTQAEINRTLLLTLIGCAILILLCWFADPGARAIPSLRQSAPSTARKQA